MGVHGKQQIPLYKVTLPPDMAGLLTPVFESGQIASGPNVAKFESLLQGYVGNPYITATSDVSASIEQSLFLAGVHPGDEVLASPMACLATNVPIRNLFAQVRWCDIDALTGSIDPEDVKRRISSRTKAILVFHWAGNPVDLDAILQIARSNGLRVIEDAGEALGAEYRGKKIGNTGTDYTIFSFYPNRHITTLEGAAISCAHPEDYERVRWHKRYGIHQPSFRTEDGEINPASDVAVAGTCTYMNNISAAVGLAQFKSVAEIIQGYQANGSFYDQALQNVGGIAVLRRLPDTKSAYWVYTFLAENRNGLLRRLREKGVYASRVHLRNDVYSCFGPLDRELPGVDRFQRDCLSIPCGSWIGQKEREYIVESIREGW